jgi:hypothetical protein
MPRSTRSRSRKLFDAEDTTISLPNTKKEDTVTAASTVTEDTVREMPFEVDITPAPADYRPDRSPAGRKRTPSPFEPLLPGLKGKGWQNQPHDGKVVAEDGKVDKYNTTTSVADSNARIILRELSKAVKFLNSEDGGSLNLGLDVNVTATDVQFNIRDKQARKSKTVDGEEATDGERDDDDSEIDADEA